MDVLIWIQQWYQKHCDGDWEHNYGIKIETLDNPGWLIEINLEGTELEDYILHYKLIEKSNDDWYAIKIANKIFYATGDAYKLEFLLEKFRVLALQ